VSTQATELTIGMMGECVMSIYGISRLLNTRDLGAAKILPTVEAFGSEVKANCAALPALFQGLHDEAPQSLKGAVDLLRVAAEQTTGEIVSVFDQKRKLNARERLALERDAERLGGQLQGVRDLLDVLHGALHPRKTLLTLGELLRDQWRTKPTFVKRRVELNVVGGDNHAFEVDPRVLWALVERTIDMVSAAGVEDPFATVNIEDGRFVMSFGAVHEIGNDTMERVMIELGPSLPAAGQLLEAVAVAAGVQTSQHDAGLLVHMALVAA
jgi:hypothetical protein